MAVETSFATFLVVYMATHAYTAIYTTTNITITKFRMPFLTGQTITFILIEIPIEVE